MLKELISCLQQFEDRSFLMPPILPLLVSSQRDYQLLATSLSLSLFVK